ncbi:hypothetical protein ZWY2020_025334 [Hordeum vulgare]|nr:hypothetical protein ZWY2020_025334 [Hordeum vulgare]
MEVLQEWKIRRDPILARKKEPPPRKPWIGPIPKTPTTYNGSVQSKSAREPLSLEEYLEGAKAMSTTLPTVQASTGTFAGMEGRNADGLGSPTCPSPVDGLSQLMRRQADETAASLGQEDSLLMTDDAAPAGLVPLCTDALVNQPAPGGVSADGLGHDGVAEAVGGGVLASAGDAHAEFTHRADEPHDSEAQATYMHAHEDMLATHDEVIAGDSHMHNVVTRPTPAAAQEACADALASARGA